jgi:hypothetical protein
MSGSTKWLGVLGVLAAIGLGIAFTTQQRSAAELRRQIDRARAQNAELARLQALNQQARASQVSESELESLRADHAVLARVRSDLEKLKQSAQPAAKPAARPAAKSEPMVPTSDWRNAGLGTPRATFETALWAAVNGDSSVLASTMELSPGAKAKAEEVLARLDAGTRAQYESPEQLVAQLTARSIHFTGMSVASELGDAEFKNLVVNLQQPNGQTKRTLLVFHRDETDWRLVVPDNAAFGAMLQGATPDAAK